MFGYPFALFLMVLLGVVLFLIFKRRGWLSRHMAGRA